MDSGKRVAFGLFFFVPAWARSLAEFFFSISKMKKKKDLRAAPCFLLFSFVFGCWLRTKKVKGLISPRAQITIVLVPVVGWRRKAVRCRPRNPAPSWLGQAPTKKTIRPEPAVESATPTRESEIA